MKNVFLNLWRANKTYILLLIGMFLLFVIATVYTEPCEKNYTIECYKGYMYKVNRDGVHYPMITRYEVRRCD